MFSMSWRRREVESNASGDSGLKKPVAVLDDIGDVFLRKKKLSIEAPMMKSWWAFCSIWLNVTSRNLYPSWKGYVHEPPPEWLGSKQCQRTDVAMLAEENVVYNCLFSLVFL